MKILVGADVPPDPNSGAAGTVFATNLALRELGHDVDEIWASDLDHRIKHWNLHYLLELPRSYRNAVAKRCGRFEYDVIQLSQPQAWLAAREHRRKGRHGVFVNRSHGLESLLDEALIEWRRRLGLKGNRFPRNLLTPLIRSRLHRHIDEVLRYCDGMVVPAFDIKRRLVDRHGADPSRIAVIPHGVPDEFLRRPVAPMHRDRCRRMLHVAQFSFFKGPRLLAEAATKILDANSEVTLTWVCERNAHDSAQALFPRRLHERVQLLDWMPQERLLDLYDAHGIHIAHSLYEGAAKASTEGMARGQVVISSAVGALKDHIRNGENGFLVETGDTDGMASAALSVLASVGRAESCSEAARATAEHLSWGECARKSTEFYRDLMDAKVTM